MKSKEERENLSFWNQADIREVFKVPYKVAKKAYSIAEEIDKEELGKFRVYETKVRSETVRRVMGIKKR